MLPHLDMVLLSTTATKTAQQLWPSDSCSAIRQWLAAVECYHAVVTGHSAVLCAILTPSEVTQSCDWHSCSGPGSHLITPRPIDKVL